MSLSGSLPERLGLVPETAGSNIPLCKEKRSTSRSNTFKTFCPETTFGLLNLHELINKSENN
jgi:hypothetical protein